MKLLYTHENRFLVNNAKNIIENAGIAVMLKNEYAIGAAGELSALDAWLELWVLEEQDFAAAERILQQHFNQPAKSDWRCNHCAELNDGAFDFCWHCQREPDPFG